MLKSEIRRILRLAGAILIFVLLIVLAGYIFPNPEEKDDGKLHILVPSLSQKMYTEALVKDGGDYVHVMNLCSGRHVCFEDPLTAGTFDVRRADVYLKLGGDEGLLEDVLKENPGIKVVDVSEEEAPGSPLFVKDQVKAIADYLAAADPRNREVYYSNLSNLEKDIDILHEKISDLFAGMLSRTVVMQPPAWAHFLEEFDLEAVLIPSEGDADYETKLKDVYDTLNGSDVKVIFTRSEDNMDLIMEIANATGSRIIILDPFSENIFVSVNKVMAAVDFAVTAHGAAE
jgi:zinc transport system substrate-binding protein